MSNKSKHLEDITADDLTIMGIYIRNAHVAPTYTEVLIQVSLFAISALLTILAVVTVFKFTVFHKNQRNIFASLLLFWFELLLSRVILWKFKYTLTIDYNGDFALLNDCERYGDCEVFENWSDPVFVAANLRYHYMFVVILAPIAILSERIFATVLVKDYERKSRRWIFITILFFQISLAFTFALITTTFGLTFPVLITATSIALLSSGIIFGFVEFFNIRRLRILEKNHRNGKYSLSIRYQLKENLKTLKLMRRFFLSIIGFIVVMGLANSIPVLMNMSAYVILIVRQYLDFIFHSNPIVLIPIALITIDAYRNYVTNKVRTTLGYRAKSQKVDIRKLKAPENVKESDVYFSIFEKQMRKK
ncbi:unnamed protein product [Caenorhabditis angaria]|uniref:Uncharacterized protein n=1 Tax=Caenorhabditis angaria TaxID=860376 RepID=A0A9P1MX25_9PELO|nr:unnamed protein product [Caenorhabditis angaria]